MITYRRAQAKDVTKIASLHALSWQTAYKGIMTENFLKNEVEKDRLQVWQERFEHEEDYFVWIAEKNQHLAGFVCLVTKPDADKGYLLDNLHVHPSFKGSGIGKVLFLKAASVSRKLSPTIPLYLWVFDQNHQAVKFYEALEGKHMETITTEVPGGTTSYVRRYAWFV